MRPPPLFDAFACLPQPRIAAVDYGTKRVGLALADPLRLFSRPLGTYSPDVAVRELEHVHAQEGLACIVVGWPLQLDGQEGEATAFVQPYINRLKRAFPGVEIVKWDERYTSEMAKQLLYTAGVKRKARREKGRIDAAAAAILLQSYLDGQ